MSKVAIGILKNQKRYLMIQKSIDNLWSFPDETMNKNDANIICALKRGITEKTGYEIIGFKFLFDLLEPNAYNFHIFSIDEYTGFQSIASKEICGIGWFSLPEMYRMNDSLSEWLKHYLRDVWFAMRHE